MSSRSAVGSGENSNPSAGRERPHRRAATRPRPRVLGGRPPHVAAGPAITADQFEIPTQLCGNDIRPDPWIVGGQAAPVRSTTTSRRRPAESPSGVFRDIVGDLRGGIPTSESPADVVGTHQPDVPRQLRPAGVAHAAEHRPGQPEAAATRRSTRRSARRVPPAPPGDRVLVATPIGSPANSSATSGGLRSATSMRLSPPCGAMSRRRARPAGRPGPRRPPADGSAPANRPDGSPQPGVDLHP